MPVPSSESGKQSIETSDSSELQRLKDIMIATFFEKLQERNNKEKNNNV